MSKRKDPLLASICVKVVGTARSFNTAEKVSSSIVLSTSTNPKSKIGLIS